MLWGEAIGPRIALATLAAVALLASGAAAASGAEQPDLVGALHEHSGYSDGWPGSTPRDFFAAGKAEGLDFMGSSDHSDNVDLPLVLSAYCLTSFTACLEADPLSRSDSYRKWQATLEQARAATTSGFTAFRGFEWTSDVYGHVNVFFSRNVSNAKRDGGTADFLWRWLSTPASAGGGLDGVATFNHPGAKGTPGSSEFNWRDFAYRRDVDRQVVGIETFNDQTDYGSLPSKGNPPAGGWYARALDRGWHVGAIGAEDLGHLKEDNWGGPNRAKTVLLTGDRSPTAIKAAMLARRFYAIKRAGIRLSYTLDGRTMGTRFDAAPDTPLRVEASIAAPAEGSDLHLDLVTSGGEVVATSGATLSADVTASPTRRWFYVRARRGSEPIAYSSPVWTTTSLLPDTDRMAALAPKGKPNALEVTSYDSARPDSKGRVAIPLRCVGNSAVPCRTVVRLTATLGGRTTTVGTSSPQAIHAGFSLSPEVQLSKAALASLNAGGSLAVSVSAGGAPKPLTLKPFN